MLLAITREVSPRFAECELTHLAREPIDVGRAVRQQEAYRRVLEELGCETLSLPAEPDLPDSVFVEDTAVVVDELAIIARPGADSRQPETAAIAEALFAFRELAFIRPPATLDGGDVLVLGRSVYVGPSTRTNGAGIDQLAELLAPFGYDVHGVEFRDCLHLKSAASAIGPSHVLLNPRWVEPAVFAGAECIHVHKAEPQAANALDLGSSLVFPEAFPQTRDRLERAGLAVRTVDISEATKAEGAVTCCSLVFSA